MRVISNLALCITLTLACQVYVDSSNGTDVDGCGKEDSPCRTIGDHKSVCMAPSGVYTLDKIPVQMWIWRRLPTDYQVGNHNGFADTVKMVDVECSHNSIHNIDGQGLPLIWSHISFEQCQFSPWINLLNISIETCEFDQLFMVS